MKTLSLVALSMLVLSLLTAPIAIAQPIGKPPEQLGKVSFANSCAPTVQDDLARAVALLHSFWWQRGEKAFRQVLDRDPSCAIATWGIASILIGNVFATGPTPASADRAKEMINHGRAIGAKTERERAFIEAVAQYYDGFAQRPHGARIKTLSEAFEAVAKRFPEDEEAQIFSALYLTATQSPTDKTFAATMRAASNLEGQFSKHPDHPGVAHYLIHAYDYPPIAHKGLMAARRYSEIAPSAPHALHMPSHIFTRVGAWQESAATNERSAAVAKAENEPIDRLHAMDYLAYAYLQLGRDADAKRVVEEAPQVAGVNPANRGGPYALAAIPARYAVERSAWRETAQLQPKRSWFPFTEAMTHFARAIGAARSGDPVAAARDVHELTRLIEALKAATERYWTTEVEVQWLGAAAWVAFAKGQRNEALGLMRAAADLEEKSEKAAVSPGRIVPARELLGDMLVESGRPSDALAEYERSQVTDPNRYRSLYGAGHAAALAGNPDKARYYFSRLIELAGSGEPRPETQQALRYLKSN